MSPYISYAVTALLSCCHPSFCCTKRHFLTVIPRKTANYAVFRNYFLLDFLQM